ncbi:hypothetical protein [Pseudomonas amygdali]|uniref:Uncharacterized protein n=2 Tax=Pseudomonas amygdali pv. lachrymans TaxID=53707 RepID=A0AB37R2E4_PSEAV|nr:hypothetical protein [Pseudomonas amygdali]AXH57111.1 hypothetical protein PLA107_018765 [Pseudomonas amygdali pv. lachrymans str. M301315]ARA79885.1 hypothetical protein B5U27_07300 [Pseudomonas amygdali pv. lachrymans]KKY55707.1 hypothetical protein AAY85_23355 [Pseudomonas amygdali pv. lachrymans]KPC16535.1 Uncharacterized protein AC499_6413 [Pseudomonas amygdali pv. lachrymans]PWD03121.1 hypothetical protein CX658_12325 [Pseudomonas amygdali pv. lachrymans]
MFDRSIDQWPRENCVVIDLIDRVHLAPLQIENRQLRQFKTALSEWADKTEWLRKSVEPKELSMHLADVMKGRIDRNQCKAELYDEVWELAIGLGYMNVTTAIGELRKEHDQLKEQLGVLERFTGYLLDYCEGQVIYGKKLQYWLACLIEQHAALSRPDTITDVESSEATGDCHDDDMGDGEAERMKRNAKNESTAYDGFDNGVD